MAYGESINQSQTINQPVKGKLKLNLGPLKLITKIYYKMVNCRIAIL